MRALALLLALAVLAGCTGRDGATQSPLPDAVSKLVGPSAEEMARAPGILRGLVRTAAHEPVANATVEEPRLSLRATTDAAGAFELRGLPTGEHLLTIEAAQYVTRSVTLRTQNGTTLAVDIVLERMESVTPYMETRELNGFLTCAARIAGETPDCASADPNHRDTFEFDMGAKGGGVILELVWDAAATPVVTRLTLSVETVGYGAQDIDLGNATGEGYARVEVPISVMEKYYPEGGVMRAIVGLAEADVPVALAAQTSFTVYVSVFYHGPAPAGFSVLAS